MNAAAYLINKGQRSLLALMKNVCPSYLLNKINYCSTRVRGCHIILCLTTFKFNMYKKYRHRRHMAILKIWCISDNINYQPLSGMLTVCDANIVLIPIEITTKKN